jgi:hypothetical protein
MRSGSATSPTSTMISRVIVKWRRRAADRRQPPAQVLDAARVGTTEAQPGFLDGVVGLARRAEHPPGMRPQASPIGLESSRQPLAVMHRSHSLVAFRQ